MKAIIQTSARFLTGFFICLNCTFSAAQSTSVFFLEDFSGGFPTDWNAADNAGNGVNWKHTYTGAINSTAQPFPSVLSPIGTSASDGYLIYDSDSSGQSVGGEDADLTSLRIDCSGRTNVHFSFNQLLVHLNEIARVYISTDSTSWIEVARPSDSLVSYSASSNPELLDIDISAIVDSQPSVWIRFNYFGDYDFWWMIDDVKLYESVASPDLNILDINSPSNSCTGSTSTEPVTVEIRNHGNGPTYAFDLGFRLDNGQTVIEHILDTLFPGSVRSFTFQSTVDLSIPAGHELLAFVNCTGDQHAEDDSLEYVFFSGPTSGQNYQCSFENRRDRAGWCITDSNNDGISWMKETNRPWDSASMAGDSCMALEAPTANSFANDWLVSPCIEMKDTSHYQISFLARAENDSCDGFIQVMLLSDSNTASLVSVLSPLIYVSDSSYLTLSTFPFQPAVSGTYHIGLHTLSAGRRTSIRLDRFDLENPSATGTYTSIGEGEPFAYPNPFNEKLLLTSIPTRSITIRMLNTTGQSVLSKEVAPGETPTIDTAGLPAGAYIVEKTGDGMPARDVFIKQ